MSHQCLLCFPYLSYLGMTVFWSETWTILICGGFWFFLLVCQTMETLLNYVIYSWHSFNKISSRLEKKGKQGVCWFWVCLSVYPSVWLSALQYVFRFLLVTRSCANMLSVCLSVCLSACLSVCLSLSLSLSLSLIHLQPLSLFVCLFFQPSFCRSVCLSSVLFLVSDFLSRACALSSMCVSACLPFCS